MYNSTFLQQIMEQSLEMVIVFEESGRIQYANRMANLLLEFDFGLDGESITHIFPGTFSKQNGVLSSTISYGEKMQSLMAYRSNKTCFPVEARIIDQRDSAGVFLCMAVDASKQNYYARRASVADEQVTEAQQVKTQFVANVTHELRTPVNGILGNAQQLIEIETEPRKQKLLRLIERGCNDMHAIINNILDFSKLEAGKVELEKRSFQFRGMMEYIKSTHINKINEKGLQFFMTISPDIPEYIIGDELRIGQVLNNLLSNATKFTSTGRITVEVVKTAQMDKRIELFFMVIDTGIGIAQDNLDRLFKSFSQVEASTTRKYGGTGLGLNISKQLVELMDGSIHVESEPNRGTMFSFHIWVDVPEEEASGVETVISYEMKMPKFLELDSNEQLMVFGSAENREELERKLNKLILSVEMDNWEKAEMFMESVKQLTMDAPQPVKSSALRLKMAVQKADYDKVTTNFEIFKQALAETNGENT